MRVTSTQDGEAFASRVAGEVRAEMARQGISQQALADRLGWKQPRLSRRIAPDGSKNRTTPFDVCELRLLAQALEVPVSRLIPSEVSVP